MSLRIPTEGLSIISTSPETAWKALDAEAYRYRAIERLVTAWLRDRDVEPLVLIHAIDTICGHEVPEIKEDGGS